MSREKKENPEHGKKHNQKLKPYLVLQYLMRETDENNVRTADDIAAYLVEFCNIPAERRSIYEDIKAINRVLLMLEEECDIDEAIEMLEGEGGEEYKTVVYDKNRKGFYVCRRNYEADDIRLLAECVYAAKFINEGQAKRLVNVVCGFVSETQAEKIRHNAFLVDRVKTHNSNVLNSISTINQAMSRKLEGRSHIPEKIRFKYLKYNIANVNKQVERRSGADYVVSPFQLLINDGNYYLLAFDGKSIKPYRVDRMKDVQRTGEPREGQAEFDKIDIRTYTQRVFSMFGGKKKRRVTIRFLFTLLDTAVERFGTRDAQYSMVDDKHFTVNAEVEISEQFFGWILGFGKRVKVLYPNDVVEDFKAYLDKVREMY